MLHVWQFMSTDYTNRLLFVKPNILRLINHLQVFVLMFSCSLIYS
jgi:hypothetical protein